MHYFLCHAFCQYDRGVFLQKAKLPPKVKGAAPRASSWASWILFKLSKSWEVLISKYFSGLCLLLAVSSPPDFDTNNLIEKSGRGTGGKKTERKKEKYLFQPTATKWKSGRGVPRGDNVSLVWGDFKANPVKQSPSNRWLIYSFKHFKLHWFFSFFWYVFLSFFPPSSSLLMSANM